MTEATGDREDQTWGTNRSSNATAESAFEDAREIPASPAMTGAPTAPATAERGNRHSKELLRHREELYRPRKGGKDLGSYGTDRHAQLSCRLRGHEIRLLVVYHNPQRVTKRQQLLDV